MNTANPLHWIALLFVLGFVVLPSAAALIGVYLHAYRAEGDESEGRKEGKEEA